MILEKPESLLLLFLLVPLVFFILQDRKISKIALQQIVGQSPQFERKMFYRWFISSVLVVVTFLALILSLSQPTFKVEALDDTREGINVLLGLDISKSMEAQDTPPNRLERAKLIYLSLVEKISFKKLSVMLMRGEPAVYVPFSSDISFIKRSLADVRKEFISTPGSDLIRGLQLGRHILSKQPFSHQIALIASDGDGVDVKKFESEIQECQKAGIQLVILGMGGTEDYTQVDQGSTHTSKQNFPNLLRKVDPKTVIFVDTNALTIDETVSNLASIINLESNRNIRLVPHSLRFYFIALSLICFVSSLLIRPIKWRVK